MAGRDVARYRRKGPSVTTRLLRDGLRAAGPLTGTLLDIGSGIRVLTLELLDIGVNRAVAVDASEAYLSAARNEAPRRVRAGAVDWRHGDLVSLASEFRPATVVTLDRVICCYPAFPARRCGVAVETILIYPSVTAGKAKPLRFLFEN